MSWLASSWYLGSTILSLAERLIQMLMPLCTPCPPGISACTTPRPAVIH
uniref:Uncharacterized protein n=1 Tax=Arundo donax TaxID=35708 RepID=A0A0A9DH19_ARUDO